MKAMNRIVLLLTLAAFCTLPACSKNLFNDKNSPENMRIGKYYDGDSAYQKTLSRRHTADMGFGYPTGPAGQ